MLALHLLLDFLVPLDDILAYFFKAEAVESVLHDFTVFTFDGGVDQPDLVKILFDVVGDLGELFFYD